MSSSWLLKESTHASVASLSGSSYFPSQEAMAERAHVSPPRKLPKIWEAREAPAARPGSCSRSMVSFIWAPVTGACMHTSLPSHLLKATRYPLPGWATVACVQAILPQCRPQEPIAWPHDVMTWRAQGTRKLWYASAWIGPSSFLPPPHCLCTGNGGQCLKRVLVQSSVVPDVDKIPPQVSINRFWIRNRKWDLLTAYFEHVFVLV